MLLKESAPGPLICNLNMLLVTNGAAEKSAVMQLCLIGASIMPRSVRRAQHFDYYSGLYQRLTDCSPWPKSSSNSSVEILAVFAPASLHVTVYWTVQSMKLHTTNRALGWPCHSSSGYSLASHRCGPSSSPGLVMWDLWWGRLSPCISVSPANFHSTSYSTITICQPGLVQ
jgi:hypothetical protein